MSLLQVEETDRTSAVQSSADVSIPASNYDIRHKPWMYSLSSKPYHILIWTLVVVGILGNALVVVWRCTRQRGHRTSTLSLLIVTLAIADFLYCVHLLILEIFVMDDVFGEGSSERIVYKHSASTVCTISGGLSLFSCSTALWMTFNIAVKTVQSMRTRIRHCSIDRKSCLLSTIFFQWGLTTIPITVALCYVLHRSGCLLNFGGEFNPLSSRHARGLDNETIDVTAVFSSCALAQSNGQSLMANWSHSVKNTSGSNRTHRVTTLYCRYRHEVFVSQHHGIIDILSGVLVSLNSILTISCTVLYLYLCRFLWSSSGQSNVVVNRKLTWRLSVIVLLNTICWLPATAMHWVSYYRDRKDEFLDCSFFMQSTAANIVLISISAALNPLIYTFTADFFFVSVRKCVKELTCNCHVTMRGHQGDALHEPIIGVQRCSWIPCLKCVRRWKDLESVTWQSEETRLISSLE